MRTRLHRIDRILLALLVFTLSLLTSIYLVRADSVWHSKATSLSLERQNTYIIYEDALAPGWKNCSWGSKINFANTSPLYSGERSISFTATRSRGALCLYTKTAVHTTSYSYLRFAAQANRAEQEYSIGLFENDNHRLVDVPPPTFTINPTAGTWKRYSIPLLDLSAHTAQVKGIVIQCPQGHGILYLDSLSLTGLVSSPTSTVTATPTFTPTPVPQLTPTSGRNLYVAPSGNDSNDGTQTSPFATIKKAANAATPGTTIHVAPGTYPAPLVTNSSGTASARITYISDVKWGAKITLNSTDTPPAVWYNTGNYVDIQGFNISAGSGVYNGILYEGSSVRIIGNRVHDLGGASCHSGAGINDNTYTIHDIEIIGNVVDNIGPQSICNQIQGIYYSNYKGYIANNIVSNVAGYGIHCWHACNNVIIANNLVFSNRTGGIVIGAGDAPGGVTTDDSIVSNNIAINNAGYGIREYEYPGQNTIGTNNRFLNNIVYGNSSDGFSLLNGNHDQNTMKANAQFVNYQPDGSGDYHLKPTSPAIDAGTSIGAPTDDMDGVPRPQGKGYDIGPYEFRSGGINTPTATAATPTPTSAISNKTVFLILMGTYNWSDIKNSSSASYINHTLLPLASYTERSIADHECEPGQQCCEDHGRDAAGDQETVHHRVDMALL
jgi:hypothetical protein